MNCEAEVRMPTSPSTAVPIAPDQIPATFRPFAQAILGQGDPAPGLIRLLGTLGEKAPKAEARDFALLLRRTLPQSSRRDRVTEAFLQEPYPAWYIRAVNDPHRNAAYRRAIEALVGPETVVFEAGTGSGLFAMMAARAGARHVYTCEQDAHVAEIARANIRRNGFEDRITLFNAPYGDLKVGEHLPARADLLIHEFVAAHFMVKSVASIASEIRATLLVPEAPMLPYAFAAVGMLVGDDWLLESLRVPERVEGLDVAGINLLAPAGVSMPGPIQIEHPLSAAAVLANFDLTAQDLLGTETRRVEIEATADGTATGVLQWIRHSFPDGSVYESRPELSCNWWPYFWPFREPIPVRQGDRLNLAVETTSTEVFIDLLTPFGG